MNDQYQTRDTTSYRLNFTHVSDKAVFLAGNRKSRVFILSIPDYSATSFVPMENRETTSLQIDQFNKINKEVAEGYDISYTDIATGSRAAATDKTLLASDSLHYSRLEYLRWTLLLLAKVSAALR